MTAPPLVFFDFEGAARTWLRNHPLLLEGTGSIPAVNRRVFFSIPEGSVSYPLVTIARVGGAPERGEAPVDSALIQHDCWGDTKRDAADVARRVVQSWQQMESEPLDGEVFGLGAEVGPVVWLPDPDDGKPRYVIDVRVTARAT